MSIQNSAFTCGRGLWYRVILIVLLAGLSGDAWAQRSVAGDGAVREVPLREAMQRLEAETDYRFLYRDAVVAGYGVPGHVMAPAEAAATARGRVDALAAALQGTGLLLRVDHDRRQVLVVPDTRAAPSMIGGVVMDARDGTRLPLATVLWRDGDGQAGTATGPDGRFRIRLDDSWSASDTLVIRASYVGYAPRIVHLALSAAPSEVPIRLVPRETQAPEVVVQTQSLIAGLDTTWHDLLRAERYAPLGEANALQALQPLPSVGVSGAITSGMVVRGSSPDGFRVLLDGAPIYNSHHLFGLFDAFNADALQTVGLFYDVAPATYAAPPGGTLAFRTRTGSQTARRVTLHTSSTAASATVEAPWNDGRGSVLVSARRSTLDLISWLNNDDLIAQGLDVDRPREPLPPEAVGEVGARVQRPLDPDASFYDVHVNVYNERPSGRRVTLSLYTGADDADQGLLRLNRVAQGDRRFRIDTTRTQDEWGNVSGSLKIDEPLADNAYGRLTVAGSRYSRSYQKDDFAYLRRRRDDNNRFFLGRFTSENTMYEWSVEPRVDVAMPEGGMLSAGAAAYLYNASYDEESVVGGPYDLEQQAARLDLFAHLDVSPGPLDASLGLRTHAYSDGSFVRVSPRLRIRAWPDRIFSFGAGYARSHQFLHRIDIVGETSSSVWVPSREGQPPARADHLSAGLYVTPRRGPAVQVEAYLKDHDHVRVHETVVRLQPDDETVLFAPWTVDNTSRARGLEVLARQKAGAMAITAGYTWSRVEIDRVGEPSSPAPWDRRHQLTTRLSVTDGGVSAALTGTYATGPPSDYAGIVAGEPARLGATARVDAAVQYERTVGDLALRLRAAVYNITDRDNPWYRTPTLIWTRPGGFRSDLESRFVLLDTYDIGLQPSFSLNIRF